MEHKGTVQLETDRLILRRFRKEDARAAYENWTSDDRVTKFLTWPTHSSVEVSEYVVSDWAGRYEDERFYQWAIVPKGNGDRPIGSISAVKVIDPVDTVHIGYCIGYDWWHQGIMPEALHALIRFFFEEVKANRIEAVHDVNNPNSGRVMAKCGMQYEGTHREAGRNNQGICDECFYAILQKDWEQGQRS
ncbi:MAG: GNAT family N-acetyltransferase [Lachnospiraceae bacterium]|nr:GNAT family N-acetyltransferase [Lachnospiraceae bacterium]